MKKRVLAAILAGAMILQCGMPVLGEESIQLVDDMTAGDQRVEIPIAEEAAETEILQDVLPEEEVLPEEIPPMEGSDVEEFLPGDEIVIEPEEELAIEIVEEEEAGEIEEMNAEDDEILPENEETGDQVIPASAVYWHGHYYQVYNAVMTPAEAAEYCKSVGGYLATITSAAEKTELQGLIMNQGSYAKGYFISEINKSGEQWYWATGEAFEYQNWASYWNYGYGNGGDGWTAGRKLGYMDDGSTPTSHHYMCYKFALDDEEKTGNVRYNYYVSTRYPTSLGKTGGGYGEEDFCENVNKYGYGFVCEWGDPISITDEANTVMGAVNTAVYTYDGKLKNPAFSLWYIGDKDNPLEPNYDYSYCYIDNQDIGTASVVVEGKGRYQDEKILSYKINPAQVKNVALTVENGCSIRVTWAEVQWGNVTKDTGYHIEWSTKSSFPENETYAMDVTADKQEYLIEELNGSTTYYVRVNAYAYAGENEGAYSSVVNKKTGSEFHYYQYQADYYRNNKMSAAESTFKTISPCKTLYDTGVANGLELNSDRWNSWTTVLDTVLSSPSGAADKVLEEKDMYAALIFAIMEGATEQQDKEGINADTVKVANKMYTQIYTWVKVKDHIDLSNANNWASMTTEQRGSVISFADQWLKDQLGIVGNAASKVSTLLKGLEYIEDFQDWCTYVSNYAQMMKLGDSMKTILWEMYEQCPAGNTAMRRALYECVNMMESSTEQMLAEVLEKGTLITMVDAGKFAMDELWKTVKAEVALANPYAALLWAAYGSAKLLSNQLLGADSITEKYFKMEALLNIRSVIWNVYNTEKSVYTSAKNETTAANFLSAADMLFRCLDLDCECAVGFVGAIDDAWMTSALKAFGKTNTTELKTTITNMRKSISSQHDAVSNDWIYQLESDFPAEYKNYVGMIRTSVSGASVILSNDTYDFDGTSKEPGITVRCNGKTLVRGVDYEVAYSGNISAGTALATVRGIGNSYNGIISETFTINAPAMEKAQVSIPDCVFSEGGVKPEITVICNGRKMVKGIDYTVTYENDDAVGTATATITGIGGNCIGTVSKTFNIVQPPAPAKPDTGNSGSGSQGSAAGNAGNTGSITNGGGSSHGSTQTVNVTVTAPKIKSAKNASAKAVTVKWKKVNGVTGYQIQYSTSSKFKKAKSKTIKKSTATSKKLTKLKKGKKYYIRMRAYKSVNGKTYYSSWSKKKTVKVKK